MLKNSPTRRKYGSVHHWCRSAWARRQLRAPRSRLLDKESVKMAALTPITVHVEKPVGVHFSECFAEMRMWLTAHKITPVHFHLSGGYSSIGLDIAFSNFEEADLFEREFSPAAVR